MSLPRLSQRIIRQQAVSEANLAYRYLALFKSSLLIGVSQAPNFRSFDADRSLTPSGNKWQSDPPVGYADAHPTLPVPVAGLSVPALPAYSTGSSAMIPLGGLILFQTSG